MEYDWTHHVRSSLGRALETPRDDLHQASNRIGAYINAICEAATIPLGD
jgi:hypothetical protein